MWPRALAAPQQVGSFPDQRRTHVLLHCCDVCTTGKFFTRKPLLCHFIVKFQSRKGLSGAHGHLTFLGPGARVGILRNMVARVLPKEELKNEGPLGRIGSPGLFTGCSEQLQLSLLPTPNRNRRPRALPAPHHLQSPSPWESGQGSRPLPYTQVLLFLLEVPWY